MSFPLLSLLVLTPLAAGLVILALPRERRDLIRWLALGAGLVMLLCSLALYAGYDQQAGGYQFIEYAPWLPQLGIAYHLGVDGLAVAMLVLTGLVVSAGVIVSWKVEDRPREFFSFMMFLAASVAGVFASLDLFLLFFFFEIAVFPKYLMIVTWGSPETRNYGGMKLTLYLFIGSLVALVGVLALYVQGGTFNFLELQEAGFSTEFQRLWFPFVFFGFAVLGAIFPFHSWAPDGHVAAPTAISMLLAGVEMKVGVFAALRAGIMLMPEGAQIWSPVILALATVNVVYGAFIAMIQTDFKYVIGFSSVSHMGLVLIGLATLTPDGIRGAGLQMFSHGTMTALFFAIVGMVYDQAHTRDMGQLGGLMRKMPWAAAGFVVAGLVSMGMPGFSGFIAEFPIFMGAWRAAPIVAVIAVLGIIITAAYIFLVVRRVFFGEVPPALAAVEDIPLRDKITIGVFSVIMIAIGWFPSLIVPLVETSVQTILQVVGGA
ncbi:MAG TPA: NADH-quinone oxidoreductase subunit M [Chloroflexi bacterium]|nr:NADH-quinone oxidoreductase subunit M [Chloroflexota bacterium]